MQATLLAAIQSHATTKPYQNSAYLAGIKADAAAQRVAAARAELAELELQLAAKRSEGAGNRGGAEANPSALAAAPDGSQATDMVTDL